MSATQYLYVKTHLDTGMKYLGKTKQDPQKYRGSGIRWKAHIAKHGYNVTTEVLLETEDNDELSEAGLYYSKKWNVVESDQWANLTEEKGQGGAIYVRLSNGVKRSPEEIAKWKSSCIRNGTLGKNNANKMVEKRRVGDNFASNKDPEVIAKINATKKKNKQEDPNWGKHSEEARKGRTGLKRKPYARNHTCSVCGHASTKSVITRFHESKCKTKKEGPPKRPPLNWLR